MCGNGVSGWLLVSARWVRLCQCSSYQGVRSWWLHSVAGGRIGVSVPWKGVARWRVDVVKESVVLSMGYRWLHRVVVINDHYKRGKLDVLSLDVIP